MPTLAPFAAALLAIALPWDGPPPPPKDAQLVLTQPPFPDPPPEGSVIDLPDERLLPLHWRSTEKADPKARGNAGLPSLNASGSGQFSRDQFYAVREVLRRHRVVVVDLRQEPHTFLDGAAISWGPPTVIGTNRTAEQVEDAERAWTARLNAKKFTTVTAFAPGALADQKTWEPIELKIDIRDARVEYLLIAEARWGYFRIAAPDIAVPRDQDVDRFVAMVRELDGDIWLHFHCDTGRNRTAMFLALYDMMRNYVSANRPEILARQRRLSDYDLLAGPDKAARSEFLDRFFSYCWQAGPLFRRSWSNWSRANPPDQPEDPATPTPAPEAKPTPTPQATGPAKPTPQPAPPKKPAAAKPTPKSPPKPTPRPKSAPR